MLKVERIQPPNRILLREQYCVVQLDLAGRMNAIQLSPTKFLCNSNITCFPAVRFMHSLDAHVHGKDLIATRTSQNGDAVILVFRGSNEDEFRVALDPDGVGSTVNLILEAAAHATAKRGKAPVSAVDVHETMVMESPSRPDLPAIGFSLRPQSPWLAFRLPKSKLIELARNILERLAPKLLASGPEAGRQGMGH